MSRAGTPKAYSLADLRIISDLPLPGLTPCSGEIPSGGEILIRRAPVCESLSTVGATFPDGQCNETEFLMTIPGVGRYLLHKGNEILVDPAPASDHRDVCAYLLGTMLGVQGHQRGTPPLHASAIDVAGGCVAFVGESGAGKSTLAAALAARQHQVIADDVCLLKRGDEGEIWAWPGIGRLRLWEDAVAALDCNCAGVERELRGLNKYLVPVPSPPNPSRPRRLRRIYQLHAAPDGCAPSMERLQGATVFEVLIQNIYRLGFAERMGYKPASFLVCAAAARDVPLFRFSRPRKFDALKESVELLEHHLLTS
jgi:hypothetical protein